MVKVGDKLWIELCKWEQTPRWNYEQDRGGSGILVEAEVISVYHSYFSVNYEVYDCRYGWDFPINAIAKGMVRPNKPEPDLTKYSTFKVGDVVAYNVDKRGRPTALSDKKFGFSYGEIIKRTPIVIETRDVRENYVHRWVVTKDISTHPQLRKPLETFTRFPKDIFYVEVLEDIPGIAKEGEVSRACKDPHDTEFSTLRLLDFNKVPKYGFATTPAVSWFEIEKISKTTYYRRKSKK